MSGVKPAIPLTASSMRKNLITKCVAAALLAVVLSGCAANSSRMNKLVIGMPREDVIRVLGKPHVVSAQGNQEYLTYNFINRGAGDIQPYSVRLINRRVEAFGEKSDFLAAKFAPLPTNAVAEMRVTTTRTTNSPHGGLGATASNPPTSFEPSAK